MQKKEKSFGKVTIYHRCTLPALGTLGCSEAFLLFRCFCVFLKDPKYYCCNCFERRLLKPINLARCNKYCYILCKSSLCGCKDTTTKAWSINSVRDSLLECMYVSYFFFILHVSCIKIELSLANLLLAFAKH